eukprot:TRINITY_DN12297_c0_g1_i2.p1 TRINITY_DN12297_c0_g1~~TRINITY_DN12297_c0_g1_i2.p1  ORF type:complete len:1062 (-),score=213.79 TRINITY_DN12297_c0_g1_i2:109-3294(-)
MGNVEAAIVRNVDKRTSRRDHREHFQAAVERFRKNPFDAPEQASRSANPSHSVRVFVRKRPMFPREFEEGEFDVVTCLPQRVVVHDARMHADMVHMIMNHQDFGFDETFGEKATNDQVYAGTTEELVQLVLDGGSATAMMYGQTGSGKTYTMSSIYQRVTRDLFPDNRPPGGATVTVSFVEMFGEVVYDMLNQGATTTLATAHDGSVHPYPCTEVAVESAEELLALIDMAAKMRATAATGVHDQSSRSHAICRVFIEIEGHREGCLTLVDLAGSEHRIDSMEHNAERRKEGAKINASLCALKECVRAMAAGAKFIAFRQNKLTQILRNCFDGSGHHPTVVIATVSPSSKDTEHSMNTLRHACIMDGQGETKAKGSEHMAGGITTKEKLGQIDVTKLARERKEKRKAEGPVSEEYVKPKQPAHQKKVSNTNSRASLDRRCLNALMPRVREVLLEARVSFGTLRQRKRLARSPPPSALEPGVGDDAAAKAARRDACDIDGAVDEAQIGGMESAATLVDISKFYESLDQDDCDGEDQEQPAPRARQPPRSEDRSRQSRGIAAPSGGYETSGGHGGGSSASDAGRGRGASADRGDRSAGGGCAEEDQAISDRERALGLFRLFCNSGRGAREWRKNDLRLIGTYVAPILFGDVKLEWQHPNSALDELERLVIEMPPPAHFLKPGGGSGGGGGSKSNVNGGGAAGAAPGAGVARGSRNASGGVGPSSTRVSSSGPRPASQPRSGGGRPCTPGASGRATPTSGGRRPSLGGATPVDPASDAARGRPTRSASTSAVTRPPRGPADVQGGGAGGGLARTPQGAPRSAPEMRLVTPEPVPGRCSSASAGGTPKAVAAINPAEISSRAVRARREKMEDARKKALEEALGRKSAAPMSREEEIADLEKQLASGSCSAAAAVGLKKRLATLKATAIREERAAAARRRAAAAPAEEAPARAPSPALAAAPRQSAGGSRCVTPTSSRRAPSAATRWLPQEEDDAAPGYGGLPEPAVPPPRSYEANGRGDCSGGGVAADGYASIGRRRGAGMQHCGAASAPWANELSNSSGVAAGPA